MPTSAHYYLQPDDAEDGEEEDAEQEDVGERRDGGDDGRDEHLVGVGLRVRVRVRVRVRLRVRDRVLKPASSPLNASSFIASAPTKYDMASSPVARKGWLVDLVGLNRTSHLPGLE